MKKTGFFSKQKDFLFALLILLLAIGVSYYGCFASMGVVPIWAPKILNRLDPGFFSSFYFQIILLILLFVLLAQRKERNYLNFTFQGRDLRDSLLLFLGGYLAVVFLVLLVYLVLANLTHNLDAVEPTQTLKSLAGFLTTFSFWKITLFLAVNALFEESIIRALFMNELGRFVRQGPVVVILSALVQAGYHLYQGWVRSLLVFFIFLIFASYYQKYKRTTPLVLAHFYVDFLSFTLLKVFKVEL
jgi:membrane protease YdiL (CAAX protease family)